MTDGNLGSAKPWNINTPSAQGAYPYVSGIRHDLSHLITAHTWQYDLYDSVGHHIGIYPGTSSGANMGITVFGIPCIGCKASPGGSTATETSSSFDVWPSIAMDHLFVAFQGSDPAPHFDFVDGLGRVVTSIDIQPNVSQSEISTVDLPSGLYLARLTAGNWSDTKKIIVKH